MPRKPYKANPSSPLPNARHEAFALAVSTGRKLLDAYAAAGFTGKTHASAWKLRHDPRVAARVNALAMERVKADTRSFTRRQKVKGDILDAAVKRLADLAFTDLREIVSWADEPEFDADGALVTVRKRLVLRDSADISPQAATLLKGAFVKAGEVRIETHDQRAALVDLVKLLKGSDAAPSQVTVNQVNVGSMSAIDAAQRVAFLLAAAARIETHDQRAAPPMLDVTPAGHNSKVPDGD